MPNKKKRTNRKKANINELLLEREAKQEALLHKAMTLKNEDDQLRSIKLEEKRELMLIKQLERQEKVQFKPGFLPK